MSEPAKAIRRIFNMFDLDKNGVIDRDELRTVMKGLQLFPSSTQLRHIIADVDTKQDGVIDFEEFAAMRRGEESTELNVLAEFCKFNVDWLHRGYITEEAIRTVLESEGYTGKEVDACVEDLMACDTNQDGKISYRDLYERMMGRVPEEWLEWVHTNVQRGVSEETILQILEDNGFRRGLAVSLLTKTKRDGRQHASNSYVDHTSSYVYTVRS